MFDLNDLKIPASHRAHIEKVLKDSWIEIHAATVDVPRTETGIETLLKYVKIEKEGRNRLPIVHRLYRKAADIRRELEEKKLYGARTN